MTKKSEFRKLMEKVFEDAHISLKEWDDPNELKYMNQHPDDHTGSDEITIDEVTISVDEQHAPLIKKAEELGYEKGIDNRYEQYYALRRQGADTTDFFKNTKPDYDESKMSIPVKVEYEISGYPYEEVSINKIMFEDMDITNILTDEEKAEIYTYIEENTDLTDNYNKDVRDTYYGSIL